MHTTVDPYSLKENFFDLINNQWFLLTAGTKDSYNTMTASWGGIGILWHKPVVNIFIRPQRFTHDFAIRQNNFTLSFFDEEYKHIHKVCGSKSGRDTDKIKETGITPVVSKNGGVYFQEAKLVIDCKKIYWDKMKPENILVPEIPGEIYPNNDFHTIFIGEIIECLQKK